VSRLGASVRLVGFAALTLPLMPVQWLLLKTGSKRARRLPHWYHRRVLRVLRIRLTTVGEPVNDKPCLIASNHVSWLDIPVLSAAAPVSFIAKREVAHWPFFGILARLQRSVFIERDRRHATGKSRDEMRERLVQKETIVLFPEGTSSDGVRILPFKSSFFGAAEAADVVVQPVTVAYHGWWGLPMNARRRPFYAWYGEMDMLPHLWGAVMAGPLDVTVIFHPPMTAAQAGGRKALAAAAESAVKRTLAAALTGSPIGVGEPPR
jgi:1-acyl-sn-glycerol-3-phosphate acyltransferase